MTRQYEEIVSKVFRDSKARKVAEILIDGRPHSRQELSRTVRVRETTVPRVIRILKENGIPVDTVVGEDGRQSVYQVRTPGKGTRKEAAEVVARDGAASSRIRSLWLHGETVEVETEGGTYSFAFHDEGSLGVKTPAGTEITLV